MDVYLEIGNKRTFAGALEWPGWCRSAKDEAAALQALLDYGPRYGRAIQSAQLGFKPPDDLAAFRLVERLEGNANTDFGAPSVALAYDAGRVDEAELQRLRALLEAMWRSFEAMVKEAEGKELRKGPRGGGRDLEGIVQHVQGAEAAYLSKLGGKVTGKLPAERGGEFQRRPLEPGNQAEAREGLTPLRPAILSTLGPAARGELPRVGPRGGLHWTARYFVRRTAWHVLDHLWEIEDRL
jgi:hypothetical protein